MDQIWMKALKDSIFEVFNTMFFLVPVEEPELGDELAADPSGDWYQGGLVVTQKPQTVLLLIWAPKVLVMELAGNILSCEPEDLSEADMLDAFQEMLNMVAGSVLTVADQGTQWKMGLPRAKRCKGGQLGKVFALAQNQLYFDVEGRPMAAGLTWRKS